MHRAHARVHPSMPTSALTNTQLVLPLNKDDYESVPQMLATEEEMPPKTLELNRYNNVLPTMKTIVVLPVLEGMLTVCVYGCLVCIYVYSVSMYVSMYGWKDACLYVCIYESLSCFLSCQALEFYHSCSDLYVMMMMID
jgi:hypothetical protein